MDNELRELCREVYKRTGWDGDKQFAYDDTYGDKWLRHIAEFPHKSREWRLENMIPLYTSDYLLDRMPEGVSLQKEGNGYWTAMTNDQAEGVSWYEASAKSPLKALLKLTIALDDAKQLKGDK